MTSFSVDLIKATRIISTLELLEEMSPWWRCKRRVEGGSSGFFFDRFFFCGVTTASYRYGGLLVSRCPVQK